MHIVIWLLAAVALALWSLLAWGLAALLGMDPALPADLRGLVDWLPFADWLDLWAPGWRAMAEALVDMTRAAFGWLRQSAGLVVGIVWACGALLIVGSAAVLSGVVALVRRSSSAQRREAVVQ